ncbi:MAG TPA: type II toxin-antitoxin system PemK/MazF family toxin [Propionibacteriaceae bacterium]|nr:type II toxin-antitoxin system PemK/MazF family toxin [Propionibacteriaceae bacterium]
MLRGDTWLTDLAPTRAGEAHKRRPAVAVSNDHANATAARRGRGVVTVVPLTSNIAHVYPFQVLLTAEETRDACGLQGTGGADLIGLSRAAGPRDRTPSHAPHGPTRRRAPASPESVESGRRVPLRSAVSW